MIAIALLGACTPAGPSSRPDPAPPAQPGSEPPTGTAHDDRDVTGSRDVIFGHTWDTPCEDPPPTGAADDLALAWCARVSPERDQDWPFQPGNRCGFFNLTGDYGVSGAVDPVVLYCDADPDGGLRTARYEEATGTLSSTVTSGGNCAQGTGTGSLVPNGDGGLLGVYTQAVELGHPLVTTAVDALGNLVGAPVTQGGPDVTRLSVTGEPHLAGVVDPDDRLWAVPLGPDGVAGAPALVTAGVRDVAAVSGAAGEALLATCGNGVHVFGVDATTGASRWVLDVADSDCDDGDRVGLAADPDGTFVVAWGSPTGAGHAALYGPGPAPLATYDLGEVDSPGIGPRAASSGAGFVVVGPDGLGLVLDPVGSVTRTFHHPGIALHAEMLRDLVLEYDGARIVFAPVWTGVETAGEHVFNYDVIELTGADLGAP
jgi:hypothetical protein